MLALPRYDDNTISLAMRLRSGNHPKQTGFDASNLITVLLTPYNGAAVQNVIISLINCQSICNKSDEIYVIPSCSSDSLERYKGRDSS